MSPAQIIAAFDALDAGDVGLFLTIDGGVGARLACVNIRDEYTVNSLCGYGETPDDAVTELWLRATNLTVTQCILIRNGSDRRGVTWNGMAWKPAYLPDAPVAEATGQ